jgi:hypothetical protein
LKSPKCPIAGAPFGCSLRSQPHRLFIPRRGSAGGLLLVDPGSVTHQAVRLCPLWSSLAARTTAAGAAPLTLNTATSDPFDRRSSIRSASLPIRYPGGRRSWLVPCAAHALSFVIFCPSTAIASMSWTALPPHPIHHLVLDLGPAAPSSRRVRLRPRAARMPPNADSH